MEERYVRLVARVPSTALGERVVAEVCAAGAAGLEEQDGGKRLLVYARERCADAVQEALAALRSDGVVLEDRAPVEPADWATAWQEGLGAIEISPRLAIWPIFVAAPERAGQAVVRIDPGQAFGTGHHASTRLALELLDALPEPSVVGQRVLDVGAGTGVLALAALRLGASRAVALDVDALAARATRANACANALSERVLAFVGSLAALGAGRFDLLLANLLRAELTPLLPAMHAALRRGGLAILSGLLGCECKVVEASVEAAGLRIEAVRTRSDEGGERWAALLARRP